MEFQFNTVQIQSQTINKSTSKRRANKKPATKPNRRQNDVYITTKSNFKAQQKRCEELLNAGIREIYLHCLGNAIIRGLNLALNLVNNSNNTLSYAINTSTVHLIGVQVCVQSITHCFTKFFSKILISVNLSIY